MRSSHCGREAETVRAAWEQLAGVEPDSALELHIASCPACAEIRRLARSLRDARDAARDDAQPPAATVVWWRAQRRAREEAARKAARPIALIHAIALGVCAAAAVAMLSLGTGLDAWIESFVTTLPSGLQQLGEAGLAWPVGSILLLSTSLVLLPVAIYLAVASE